MINKILAVLALSVAILSAAPIKLDTPIYKFNSYKFETPQGRNMRVPRKTDLVIVAFEKETGALVNKYLDTKDPYYLLKKRTIFIADINKMPDMITKMFALPKLQKYKHLIYLHYGEKFQNDIPHKQDMITLFSIEHGKVKDISYITTVKELQAAIEK